MGNYQHLDLEERRKLYQLITSGRSPRQAAVELGRHPSTIYRELKRNHHYDNEPMFRGYFPVTAQNKAAARRAKGSKISKKPELAAYVVERLMEAWSPEQIAGYLRHRDESSLQISHATIYQFVYSPTGRRKRRRRYARRPRGVNIPLANTIAARSAEVANRSDFGHWEGDLIAFKLHHGKANLTSLIERRSRFTVLTPNPSRHSAGVMAGIERRLHYLPLPSGAPSRSTEAPSSRPTLDYEIRLG